MAGLMIDVDIMLTLIQKYFPEFTIFLEQNFFTEYFKNISPQWFVSLFIQNFSYEVNIYSHLGEFGDLGYFILG